MDVCYKIGNLLNIAAIVVTILWYKVKQRIDFKSLTQVSRIFCLNFIDGKPGNSVG